jgi:RNA polymerase sigma factor (sigma-70 family)
LEAGALQHSAQLPALAGRSPLLRLQSDEKLIALIRRGQHAAFDALVQRYQSRLLAFCRHMLGSTEDAEDVLQEVFASAFNAILADERPINARPWLYRIARNRCLNHLRRPMPAGQDSMDVFERDGGSTTADTVHRREEFRQIVADVQDLPETQKTALLLREIDALSYDQIAEAMDTTVPSVKSLLVRARVSLAEAAEARLLTCEEVRLELGQVAEGIAKTTAPVRRHLKGCERCRVFRTELRRANRALAAVYPVGPIVLVKKFFIAKLGFSAAGHAGASGSGAAASGAAAAAGASGGAISAGVSTIATKAVAGVAAAAIVTAGAVEVKQYDKTPSHGSSRVAALTTPPAPAPTVVQTPRVVAVQNVVAPAAAKPGATADATKKDAKKAKKDPNATDAATQTQTAPTAPATQPTATTTQPTGQPQTQQDGSTVSLQQSPQGGTSDQGTTSGGQGGQQQPSSGGGQASQPSDGQQSPPPGEPEGSQPQPQPAPVVGDPTAPAPPQE